MKDGPVTYCRNCGVRAPEGAAHCPNCGAALFHDSNTVRTNTMAKDRTKDTLGRDMAKAAAIGAVIAIPVPFVGPPVGAILGAAYAYRKAKKRG